MDEGEVIMSFALVTIKKGTALYVDYCYEKVKQDCTNTVWMANKYNNSISLTKRGYGIKGYYGNGAAFISDANKLKMVTPWCLYDSPLLDEFKKDHGVPVGK